MTRAMRFWRGRSTGHGRTRYVVPPIVVLVFAAVAAFVAANQLHERERERVRAGARETVRSLQARVNAYSDVIYGVRGLFEASRSVSRLEFNRHMSSQNLAQRYPGVQVVGYASYVRPSRLAAFTRAANADIRRSSLPYPRFVPKIRPGAREHMLIAYLEPQRGNELALGLDFLGEPARRRAVERSLLTKLPMATAPVRLAQETGDQVGFLIQLGTRAVDGRVTGSAYAAFRMGDLMRSLPPSFAPAAGVEVHDLGATIEVPRKPSARTMTFDGERRPRAETRLSRFESFQVLGRRWGLRYTPRASVLTGLERALPAAILLTGLLLALLTGWSLRTAFTTQRRATELAERMTADLREREAELARSNADLERFAHVASHDLREPLRTVISFLALLSRRHADRLDDDARSYIGHAVGGAQRMNELITDLLEYSRVGRTARESQAVDLDDALGVVRRNLAVAIEESGATIEAEPLPCVDGDPGELVQVLQNLVGNGLKYRSDAPPVIRLGAERRNGHWEVSVTDNGIGIDPRHHDRIFVPFQRLHGRGQYDGTGMGLAIVQKILASRGGTIRVESEVGAGSRFIVTLPAAEGSGREATAPEAVMA